METYRSTYRRVSIDMEEKLMTSNNPSDPTIERTTDRAAWLEAQLAHLAKEKAFTQAREEMAAARRALPGLVIDADYTFGATEGTMTLADLFDGRPQLIVQHFMYGEDWAEGCPMCSFWADSFDGLSVHLAHRNTSFVLVSTAPVAELEAYRERMGWDFRWVSSGGTTFNADMGVSPAANGEPNYNFGTSDGYGSDSPALSVFERSAEGVIGLTYQTSARGLDLLNSAYHLLDLTPLGRDEDDLEFSMAWLRRHDEYVD